MLRTLQLLFATLIVLTSLPAFAAFSFSPGYPRRDGGDGRPVALTGLDPLAEPRTGFNRSDCFDAAQSIQLLLSDVPSEATDVEMWASCDNTSCADPARRPGGANVQCWKIAHWSRDEVVNKVVTFKPIQVIAAIDQQTSVDSAAGLDPSSVCAKEEHMLPRAVSLQIMAFNAGTVIGWSSGGGTTGAVIGVWSVYDLAGPNPPTAPSATPTPGGLDVRFTPSTPVADFDGYNVYCFTGSAAGDAGCPSHPFVPGRVPSAAFDTYLCAGGTPSADNTMMVAGLTSGAPYAVAIAARDKAGNVGKLSDVTCDTPDPAPDAGPDAGSDATPDASATDDTVTSGCSCRATSRAPAPFGIAALAVSLAIALRRRQR